MAEELEAAPSCGHFTSVATAVFTLMGDGRLTTTIVEVPTPVSENKTVCYDIILSERRAIVVIGTNLDVVKLILYTYSMFRLTQIYRNCHLTCISYNNSYSSLSHVHSVFIDNRRIHICINMFKLIFIGSKEDGL